MQKKEKRTEKGEEPMAMNPKGYENPCVGKSGDKGSSVVAGKPASSSSASHIGYGGYPGNEQDSQAFDGDTWDASHQAKPSGMGGDKPNWVWHDKAKNQKHYHFGFDPSNPEHQQHPKRNPYSPTRTGNSPTNPWPWANMGF